MIRRKFLEILGIFTLLPTIGITIDAVAAELPVDTSWWEDIHRQLNRAHLVDGKPSYEHFETVVTLKRQKRYAEAETLLLKILSAEKSIARIEFEIQAALEKAKTDSILEQSFDAYQEKQFVNESFTGICICPISRTGAPAVWLELAVLYSIQGRFADERAILEQYIRLDSIHKVDMLERMDGITSRQIYLRYEKLMSKRFFGQPVLVSAPADTSRS